MRSSYLESLLGEREQILLVTRQHWFVLIQFVLPELLIIIAMIMMLSIGLVVSPSPLIGWGYLLLVLPALSMVRDILIWRQHLYVVTNRRVIQILGVLNKSVIDSSLEKVNDVKMVQSFLGRIFNYGDIEILTASELGINRFTRIGDPIRFKTAMLNAKQKLEPTEDVRRSEPENFPALLAQLDQLRQQGALSDAEFQKIKGNLVARL